MGILKTPGTASKPKNVSFAPGNTHYSNSNYTEDATPDSFAPAPPITPLQPNESTFRGIPGRFPASPWVAKENVPPETLERDHYATTASGKSHSRPEVNNMKKLVNSITAELLENNQQLSTLRKATKQDFDKTEKLKSQMAECVRLLTTALEERREALDFAYAKDQENSDLKAQLSEERRKNIKLMKAMMETRGQPLPPMKQKFDVDRVEALIMSLGKQTKEPALRYNRTIQSMATALRRAPRSHRVEDYAELKSTLQRQLVLLNLPDSKQLTAFLNELDTLLDLI